MIKKVIKVGDLVETCSCMPGLVVHVSKDGDDIEVQELDKIGQYVPGYGGGHSVKHCGIVKISTERATYMCALGRERVCKLYGDNSFDWNDIESWKREFEELRRNNSGK